MATLKDKIENALNEARMLVLGGQVLIGSSYRAAFNPGFQRLPRTVQLAHLAALVLMLAGLGALLLPCPFHRIVEHGENTNRLHRLITRMLEIGLFPFAVGLGVNAHIAMTVVKPGAGLTFGILLLMIPLAIWYAYPLAVRKDMKGDTEEKPVSLTEKIKEALIEARIILPGAQALLAFQVASVLTEGFDQLSAVSKSMHLAGILAVSVAIILLIAPAACHRISFRGEDSEEFYRLSGRFTLSAIFCLGLGISGDLFVVVDKITKSGNTAAVISAAMLTFLYAIWFGYSYWKKSD